MIKKGFTLSEVLVTLMIIGVIASMTIPGLKRNATERTVATTLKKTYSDLNQSASLFLNENMTGKLSNSGALDSATSFEDNFVKKKFNIADICSSSDYTKCFGYKTGLAKMTGIDRAYLLASGVALGFGPFADDDGDGGAYVFIDVNGPNKPNRGGVDQFQGFLYNDGMFAFNGSLRGGFNKSYKESIDKTCEGNDEYDMSWACAAKIMTDGWEIKN